MISRDEAAQERRDRRLAREHEEAIRNEREVQERAKTYAQVEHGPPTTCPHCGGALTPPMFEVG